MRIHFYNNNILRILDSYNNKNLKTIYQWGVYNGDSMVHTLEFLKAIGIHPNKYFGFDTFSGMPEEKAEVVDQESWKPGGINAQKFFNVSTTEECLNAVNNRLLQYQNNTQINLIPGLAEETNCDDNNKKYGFEPALLIDADFDIYSPTKHCLDYYIKNKIIVEGTLIYYDDWGGVLGWRDMLKGEARAHREISTEYDIEFEFLGQIGDEYPHVQRFYQVKKIKL